MFEYLHTRLPKILLITVGLACFTTSAVAEDQLDEVSQSLFKAQLEQAKQGSVQGQYYVGEMYEQGLGTPQNMDKAREWYKKSAAQGFGAAKNKLRQLERDKLRKIEAREEQKRRQEAETRRAELRKQLQEEETRKAAEKARKPKPAKPVPVAKPAEPAVQPQTKPKTPEPAQDTKKDDTGFSADPCKGPKAKFMSMCK